MAQEVRVVHEDVITFPAFKVEALHLRGIETLGLLADDVSRAVFLRDVDNHLRLVRVRLDHVVELRADDAQEAVGQSHVRGEQPPLLQTLNRQMALMVITSSLHRSSPLKRDQRTETMLITRSHG